VLHCRLSADWPIYWCRGRRCRYLGCKGRQNKLTAFLTAGIYITNSYYRILSEDAQDEKHEENGERRIRRCQVAGRAFTCMCIYKIVVVDTVTFYPQCKKSTCDACQVRSSRHYTYIYNSTLFHFLLLPPPPSSSPPLLLRPFLRQYSLLSLFSLASLFSSPSANFFLKEARFSSFLARRLATCSL
jgi:hypothetical protein